MRKYTRGNIQTLHVETFTYAWLHADHALDNIQATCAATSAWKRRPYAWQHIDHTRITCARKHTNHGNAEITRAETYARNTRVAIYKPRARRHVHGNIQTISVATYIGNVEECAAPRRRGRGCTAARDNVARKHGGVFGKRRIGRGCTATATRGKVARKHGGVCGKQRRGRGYTAKRGNVTRKRGESYGSIELC